MNKIKVLPPQEALKIAAGEVVERPSSVAKELVENSLDSGANLISIYIEDSGKKLIRILDNGCGMSHEDSKKCFLPHATSKINSIDDLNFISSFGFRGEALAAISSVSKVFLTTKERGEDSLAIRLEFLNGDFKLEEIVSRSNGTDIEIFDLFYNIPVRKKFLKQDETEWNQILNNFYAFAFSYIDVHFKLFRDGKLQFNLPPVSCLKSRVAQVFEHNFSENLIDLDEVNKNFLKDSGVSISGLISNNNFYRYNRSQIFFFVNQRYVKNQALSKALLKGYLNVLPEGKFPAGFLFINLDSKFVDVNVHPRKEEVKFSKPGFIESLITDSVKKTLENYVTSKISLNMAWDNSQVQSVSNISRSIISAQAEIQAPNLNFMPFSNEHVACSVSSCGNINQSCSEEFFVNNETQNLNPVPVIPTQAGIQTPNLNIQKSFLNKEFSAENSFKGNIIGQFLNTYILIEQDDALVVVDQHAAHERILYEEFSKYFDAKDGISLLFPEIITLKESHLELILNEAWFLKEQGIEIERFGNNQIAIKSSPPKIQSQSLKDLILEIISFIEENENLEKEIFYKKLNEHVHAQMSCKAAIKAGDKLSNEEMHNLLNQLVKTSNRLICVHGRPTTWVLSKNEIEKIFKRRK